MADISIQFHALPEEDLAFIEEIAKDFEIYLAVMKFFPFELKAVSPSEIQSVFQTLPQYRRWAFTINYPTLSVSDELAFGEKNPDHLRLEVGRTSEKGLEQSWLVTRTDNENAITIWRTVARRLKKMTFTGVTAINPRTGLSSRMKSFRYTKGAKSLESAGVHMLPLAGGSLLRFD